MCLILFNDSILKVTLTRNADTINPYFRDGEIKAQQMAIGSGRSTQVLHHPSPLTLLIVFSVVVSTLLATDLIQRAPAPGPSCISPFPPLLSPAPTPCMFSGATVALEMKDYDHTLSGSAQEESGALPPQGRLRGWFQAPWRGCVSTEGSVDSLADRCAMWRFSASCGFLRTRVTAC